MIKLIYVSLYNTYSNIYENLIYCLDVGTNYIIKPLICGNFKCSNLPSNIKFYENGEINTTELTVDIYKLSIYYLNNNLKFVENLEITINPIINYEIKEFEIFGNFYYNVKPILIPPNGCIYHKSKLKGLHILPDGTIKSVNLIPNIYTVMVYYEFNNIISSDEIKIIVKPYIDHEDKNIICHINKKLIVENIKLWPLGGILKSNLNYNIVNKTDLIIKDIEYMSIGYHKLIV